MRVLVACEFSGVVREAFRALGHSAWSCDLLPADDGSPYHHQGDVLEFLAKTQWDLMIAHPPCTYLANSGARWLYEKGTRRVVPARWRNMRAGATFFRKLLDADVPRIAVENPIMHRHAKVIINQQQHQVVQPWMFGEGETKGTCLWLKNLPLLQPTNIVSGRKARVHMEPPGPDRWKKRSVTYQGIADAMASQWGCL